MARAGGIRLAIEHSEVIAAERIVVMFAHSIWLRPSTTFSPCWANTWSW
jgi:hypothetical protein